MNPVCIVGAGPGGLSAAVALEARGVPFRILDAGRRPGGIWDIAREDSPMYESAHFISSRTLSGFPDFPMPEDYPDYPRHDRILRYIESYAGHHGLTDRITFGATVTKACPVTPARPVTETRPVTGVGARVDAAGADPPSGPEWDVAWVDADGREASGRFSALVVASGVAWHPRVPEIPGAFDGEVRHSKRYRSADEFRGRRVVVVGGGNSGADIACDAARTADRAFLSLRRGYHFVPKYIFGTPSDVFAHRGPPLPVWLERRIFTFLLRHVLVGDLTKFGLPAPDHALLSSHPIMNTRVLHHLGHGNLTAKPDVTGFDGREVVFADGSREEVDLVLLATGYRRAFPFLRDAGLEEADPEALHLMLLQRRVPTLSFIGIFETDGAAYPLLGRQAEVVANTLSVLLGGGDGARALRDRIATERTDLRGGRSYIDSARHDFYVTSRRYREALEEFRDSLPRPGRAPEPAMPDQPRG